ncbi:LysR family transcriptional regulator [Rhizobium sp. WYJ-E13]|uniref:LysR family transcriptional regulator n=1 Tax=Rhizobium sp. WYJ-E13 TaxID=2849093 RepID=UPI001C1F031B|nr:LysR family transcriptional regulator [Rhizobium sp. WYJ-E13]QWW69792.1 LysR family transcriptional regulator [Rhizobium sp. WYJ-E13]
MNPRQLKTFLAVARHCNFTRAASEANLAQSSLSDQMQALEEELGVQLFERSRQGVTLTPAGDTLKAYAEEILALNDEAEAAIRAAACLCGQSLAIGTLETIAAEKLAPFLSRFRETHADISLTLKIAGSGELQRRLDDGSIDIAFTFDRGERDERFMTRLISREPLALIASRNNRATPPESLADLSHLPFIATETGCVYRRLFDTVFTRAGITAPNIVTQADSIQTIIRLVASGAGYGLVPRLAAAPAAERGDVVEMSWPGDTPTASLIMLWRRRRVQPPALSSLLAAAAEAFRPVRPADARLRRAG